MKKGRRGGVRRTRKGWRTGGEWGRKASCSKDGKSQGGEREEKRREKMGGEGRGGEARRLGALSALKKRAARFFFGTNNGFL